MDLLCAETTSSSSSSSSSLAAPLATEQAYALRWPLRPPPPAPAPAAAGFAVSNNTNKNTNNSSNLHPGITDMTTTTTTTPPADTSLAPTPHHHHLFANTHKPSSSSSSSSSSSIDHNYPPRFGSNPYNRILDLASTHGIMPAAPISHPFGVGGVAATPYPPPPPPHLPHGFSTANGRRVAPPPPPDFEADEESDRAFQYHPPASFGRLAHDLPTCHYEHLFGMPPSSTDSASLPGLDHHSHLLHRHSVLPAAAAVSHNPPPTTLLRHHHFSAVPPDARPPVNAFDQDPFSDVAAADPLLLRLRSVGKSQSMRALYEENAALRRALYSMRAATAGGVDPLADSVAAVTNASSSSSGISDHRCILSDASEGRTLSMRERGRWAAVPEELLMGGSYGDPQHSSVWSGGHGRHPNYYQLSPGSCLHHRAQYVSQSARHHPAPYGWNLPKGSGAGRSGGYNYQPRSGGGGGAIWPSAVVEEEEEVEVEVEEQQRYGDNVRGGSQVQPTSLQQLIKQSCRSPVSNKVRQSVNQWEASASPGGHASRGKPKKAMAGGGHHHHHHRRSSSYNKGSVAEEESECAMCGGKLQMIMEPPSRSSSSSLLILPNAHPSVTRRAAGDGDGDGGGDSGGGGMGLPLRLCPACHPAAATVSASSFIATSPSPAPPPLSSAAAHHRLVTAISMACKPTAADNNNNSAPPNAKKKPKARILDICRHLVGLSHSK